MTTNNVQKILAFVLALMYDRGLDQGWFLTLDVKNPSQVVVLRKRDGSSRSVSFGYDPNEVGENCFQVWTEGEIINHRRTRYMEYTAYDLTTYKKWQVTEGLSWKKATGLFTAFTIFAYKAAALDRPGDLTITDADLLGIAHTTAN